MKDDHLARINDYDDPERIIVQYTDGHALLPYVLHNDISP